LFTRLSTWLALLSLLTAGACSVLEQIPLPFLTPAVQTTPTAVASTQTPVLIMAASATPQPLPPEKIVLWLPPEFDPEDGSPAGIILRDRLKAFENETGLAVEVRLKASSGPGSTLEALSTAAAAAPAALPGVTALPRADVEIAALKGLIYPLDGISTLIDNADWYAYARQLAMVQGVTFGLPFAGDGQVVVYRPALTAVVPSTW
jgi:ABC-type glycerol-3-phosphate transport system substrate-binding protein